MGSNNAVKKAPVLIIASVIETLDIFIAPKKVSQCAAIIPPAIKKPINALGESYNEIPRIFMYI